MTIKCPICGGEATLTDKDGVVEMDCPDCRVKIIKVGTLEENRKYFEGVKREPQTADEMFTDLGYSGTASGCYDSITGTRSISFFSEGTNDPDSFVSIDCYKHEVCVTFEEIRAIARKIEEMEAEK